MGRSLLRLAPVFLLVAFLVLSGANAAGRERARPPAPVLSAVVLSDDLPETREEAIAAVRAAGGRVAHVFDGFLVVEAPPESVRGWIESPAVTEIATDALAASRHRKRGAGFQTGLASWNRFFKEQDRRFVALARDGQPVPPPEEDSWFPPATLLPVGDRGFPPPGPDGTGAYPTAPLVCASSTVTQPYGATDQNTSEFLAGTVSVNVFLVESDGTVDLSTENWTAEREQAVVSQVAAALDWLRAQEPAAGLTFVYHVIPGRLDARARTGYEPITRKADPMGSTGEDLWVGRILTNMGYTLGDRWTRSRALANDTRREDKADWAVNVFVADSLNDTDGRFADSYFAYAWIGGPHIILTYDNATWGIDRLNQVLRHEFLHSFFAFDEYSGSGCTCTEHRGYLDGANANCRSCNSAAVYCVMETNGAAMCAATRRQIGWADLDADGADDVIGQDPDTFLDTPPTSICGEAVLSGQVAVVAATNRNPSGYTPKVSISVNRISGVDFRVDGGAWSSADPTDGGWGDYVEAFKVTASVAPGSHTIEMRAVDDHGNVDGALASAALTVLAAAQDPGNVVTLARGAGETASVSWSGAPAAVKYRVYRCATASGSFAMAAETTDTSWSDATSGSGYYLVRSLDACGGESTP